MADRAEGVASGGVKSRWEWVAAAVSTVLVLAVVGYLLYDAVAQPRTPPAVTLQADTVLKADGLWVVRFRAHNQGHATAAAIHVQGALMEGDRTIETSDAVLDYVPGESVRHGGLFFRADPRAYRLELRAHGYQEP
ncbi:MAG TPA: TIGR02588 family protein [Longimicrobium sp.]|nr:TIGR02588 family protein [Longimicrobium sp.]